MGVGECVKPKTSGSIKGPLEGPLTLLFWVGRRKRCLEKGMSGAEGQN